MIKIAWSALYNHPLEPGHRFPMLKYDLIPQQLLLEGIITEENLFEPAAMGLDPILAVHDPDYVINMRDGNVSARDMRKIGFPYSKTLYDREVKIMHGSIQAAIYSMDAGIGFNMAGGTHHAYRGHGEGFCIFNDIAVSAAYLLNKSPIKKILVIDLDVHQGNGTASIFKDDNRVFTFSMHGKNNYPAHKEASDLDIALPDGTGDEAYLQILKQKVPELIEQEKPGFIIYQSGVDVLESDKLGKLGLSMKGCRARDLLILQEAYKHQIPLLCVMGGGYSIDIKQIIESHCGLYRQAFDIYT